MIFVGGVMQLLVASFNVMRGNLYGSIAFFGFGTFWFSNGMTSILSYISHLPIRKQENCLTEAIRGESVFAQFLSFCFRVPS